MTHVQLKVNVETQFREDDEERNSSSAATASSSQKVIDILVELGVICILKDNASAVYDKVSTTSTAAAGSKSAERTNYQYKTTTTRCAASATEPDVWIRC